MSKLHWFIKTFLGYTVVISTSEKDYLFKHRPFRKPHVETMKKKINGLRCELICIDEIELEEAQ